MAPASERRRVSYPVSDSMVLHPSSACASAVRPNAPCGVNGRMASGIASTVQPFTPTATSGSSSNNAQRRPDVRRHATLPQSWIQRENWEFETHRPQHVLDGPATFVDASTDGRLDEPGQPVQHAGLLSHRVLGSRGRGTRFSQQRLTALRRKPLLCGWTGQVASTRLTRSGYSCNNAP